MEKIIFKNYPDTTTPLSAENLNLLQTYIENAINNTLPIELYSDADGSNTDITLSDSTENYSYLELFYSYGATGPINSTKVYSPNNKKIILQINHLSNGFLYPTIAIYDISNDTITKTEEERWRISTSGNATRTTNTTAIYVTKVIGYK